MLKSAFSRVSVQVNKSVTSVNLSDNKIGPAGAKALADMLTVFFCLPVVWVSAAGLFVHSVRVLIGISPLFLCILASTIFHLHCVAVFALIRGLSFP